jgi:hypothetical protein
MNKIFQIWEQNNSDTLTVFKYKPEGGFGAIQMEAGHVSVGVYAMTQLLSVGQNRLLWTVGSLV